MRQESARAPAPRLGCSLVRQQPREPTASSVASRDEPVGSAPAAQLVGLERHGLLQRPGEELGGLVVLPEIEARGRRPPEQPLSSEFVPRTPEIGHARQPRQRMSFQRLTQFLRRPLVRLGRPPVGPAVQSRENRPEEPARLRVRHRNAGGADLPPVSARRQWAGAHVAVVLRGVVEGWEERQACGERREVHAGGKRKPAVGADVRARRLHVHHLDGILEAPAPGAAGPPVARSLKRSGERVYGDAVDDFADLAHSKSRRGCELSR